MSNTNEKLDYPWDDLLESEPWRVDDKKEWELLEELRLLKAAGSGWVTSLDRQRVWTHENMLGHDECWLCGHVNLGYFAQGRAKVEYSQREFHCVRCEVPMAFAVTLLSAKPWRWARPSNITPEIVADAVERWRRHVVQAGLAALGEELARPRGGP